MVAMLRKPELPVRVVVGEQEPEPAGGMSHPSAARSLRVAFERTGDYDTVIARNGPEVLRIVEHGDIDLVVLDVDLGPMGGLRTLRILRGINQLLPVILTSRAWTRHLLSEALHFEASSVLRLPVELDVLFDTVHRLLTERW
jgi:CheY-like chemotaxis protein